MMTLTFENLKILSSSNQSSEKAKIISALLETNYLRNGEDLIRLILIILHLNVLIDREVIILS